MQPPGSRGAAAAPLARGARVGRPGSLPGAARPRVQRYSFASSRIQLSPWQKHAQLLPGRRDPASWPYPLRLPGHARPSRPCSWREGRTGPAVPPARSPALPLPPAVSGPAPCTISRRIGALSDQLGAGKVSLNCYMPRCSRKEEDELTGVKFLPKPFWCKSRTALL